jgi:N6-adenosine-specific RNA methylase IME4
VRGIGSEPLAADHVFAGLLARGYRVIYADPPWHFQCGTGTGSRHPIKHYRTMKLAEIKALPIADLAHPDGARLFCWATMPMLPQVLETITGWGFRYTTSRVWAKTNKSAQPPWTEESFALGPGYEVRGNVEQLIVAKIGEPKGLSPADKAHALIIAPRREHSRKPDCVRYEIAALEGPHVELFARETIAGFDSWGDEINKFDAGKAA